MERVNKTKVVESPGEFRQQPQDPECEQSVLGAMMMSKEAIDVASEILGEMDFYRESNRHVFNAIVRLHEKKEPADMMTMSNELKRVGVFETIGGIGTLSALIERCPTAGNVEYYCNIVKEKSSLRTLITAATKITADAYNGVIDASEQMDMAEFRIFEATERRQVQSFKAISKIIGTVMEESYQMTKREHNVTGVPFGFEEIDIMTEGMQDSNFIVLGARPSVGKTALGLNIAWNCASGKNELKKKIPVGIFSLEMTENELAKRLLCSVSKVNWKKARRGELLQSDTDRMVRAAAQIHEAPIFLNDASNLTVFELKAEARRLKKSFDIQLLIVDYLQLIQANVSKDTREQEVAFISRHLKALSKDLKIPILCLSQLSRPAKGQENKRPVLSDLRESGAIEQDADVVIFIHRNDWKYELIVAKQRNGPIGEVPIKFEAFCTLFESMPKEPGEGVEKTIAETKREWAG